MKTKRHITKKTGEYGEERHGKEESDFPLAMTLIEIFCLC